MYSQLIQKWCISVLLFIGITEVRAQSDSLHTASPLPQIMNDSTRTRQLSTEETEELRSAITNPLWYVATQIAPVFNVGAYYSYLMPVGPFKTNTTRVSAFTFDIGLNLSRIFGNEDANILWYVGLNADFTNFGKANATYSRTTGTTTYNTVLKNSLEIYSWYLEANYGKSILCPFASVAVSTIYLNPYKETDATTNTTASNTTETSGDYLSNNKSVGATTALGLKCKYRFNSHRELMLASKVSYTYGSSTNMIDLGTVSFNSSGESAYQTMKVNPAWFMYSIGLKYNF
jgi:hypothetical protein